MTDFEQWMIELEEKIQDSYVNGVTITQAERLAGEMLHAQMAISKELANADLDSRMRKSGLKAVRSSVYMEAATKTEKKPSDVLLDHAVNVHEVVQSEQEGLDKAEVSRDELERYYNIFGNSHVHFRTIARGSFS